MKVLFINSALTARGGAHRWLLSVLARLQGRVETHLAVGAVDEALPAAEEARVGPWSRLKGLDRRGNRARGRQGAMDRLERELRRLAPDLIQLNDVTDPDLISLAASARPAVMMVQDHRFFCPGRGKVDAGGLPCQEPMGPACGRCFQEEGHAAQMLALTRRRLEALRGMARVTVLSRYMALELAAAGLDLARVQVTPPFVDLPPAAPAARQGHHHLLAGRLSSHKGVEVALEAALEGLDLPLVVAGAGPLEPLVRRAAEALPRRVQFVGWAGRDTLATLMDRACTLWMPGLWAEPFGIVGLEALSRGVPVIATEVGGVPEWLDHGVSGLVVRPGSSRAISAAARRLEADPALAQEMGTAGRRRVARDFTAARAIDDLLELYSSSMP